MRRMPPTRVVMVSTRGAASSFLRLARTLTMALWKGPFMPPRRTKRKPGMT